MVLNQIDMNYSMICGRECQKIGTYFYTWWKCENILKFWQLVAKEINEINQLNFRDMP